MRVYVKYSHNPANFEPIYLMFKNPDSDWVPAFRDTVKGKRVVWAESLTRPQEVWIKDSRGVRSVTSQELLSI